MRNYHDPDALPSSNHPVTKIIWFSYSVIQVYDIVMVTVCEKIPFHFLTSGYKYSKVSLTLLKIAEGQ